MKGCGDRDPLMRGIRSLPLGLARSVTGDIDGAWEKYAGNPILVDLPGNVGLGTRRPDCDRAEKHFYTPHWTG